MYNGDGTASILKHNEPNVSLYRASDYSIVGKEPGEKSSQWRIERYVDNATAIEIAELEAMVAEADRVIAEAGNGIDNLAVYVSDIELENLVRIVREAKANAEAALADQANVEDLVPYIKAIEAAIANAEAAYVQKPLSSHGNTTYWFRLKNVDNGTYGFVNPSAGGVVYKNGLNIGELDAEDDNFVWAFVADGKGGFQVYNKGYDAYLYTGSRSSMLADKAEEASSYTFTVENDKKAIAISDGDLVWEIYRTNFIRANKTATYWKLELIGTEEGGLTSIVEIETEATSPALEGIYDLTGRRIDEISKPGIYIVNGKKMLVK